MVFHEKTNSTELVEFLLNRAKSVKNEILSNSHLMGFIKKTEMKKDTLIHQKVEKTIKFSQLAFLLGKATDYEGLAEKIEEINPEIREESFFDFNYMSLLLKAV